VAQMIEARAVRWITCDSLCKVGEPLIAAATAVITPAVISTNDGMLQDERKSEVIATAVPHSSAVRDVGDNESILCKSTFQ
jgi:hypothetical protein